MLRKMLVMVTFMLAMPVVAHAWTVSIQVTGPAAGMGSGPDKNNVYISNPVTTVIGGTAYAYPTATQASVAATINRAPGYDATVILNGAPVTPAGNIVTIPKSVSIAALKVTYVAQTISIPVTQAAGGAVSIAIGTATSSTGFSNVALGSMVTVTAAPSSGYAVNTIKVNNVAVSGTAGANNTMAYTFTATSSVPVTAVFDIVPNINATLTAPVTAVTSSAITATVSATSTAGDASLLYLFSANDGAGHSFSQSASTAKSFSFTPTTAGTYTVSATVSSGSVSINKSAVITVISSVGSSSGGASRTSSRRSRRRTEGIRSGSSRVDETRQGLPTRAMPTSATGMRATGADRASTAPRMGRRRRRLAGDSRSARGQRASHLPCSGGSLKWSPSLLGALNG